MNKHKSNKIKENSNTVRHLIMGQIITTQNLVAIKVVRHAGQWSVQLRGCYATKDIHPKFVLNPNHGKSHLPVTFFEVEQSFWNFAQSMAVLLPCSVQNFKMIGQLKQMLGTNEFSQDLSLRWVSDRYPIMHRDPVIYITTPSYSVTFRGWKSCNE